MTDEWKDYLIHVDELGDTRNRKIYNPKRTILECKNHVISRKNSNNNITNLSGMLVSDKTDNTLRKGSFTIDAKLDLHGLIQEKAKITLVSFINNSYMLGHKNLLIITGKGFKPDGTIGVIRKNLPIWLSDLSIADKIGAFCHAKIKDGAKGAFYVRLKNIK